MTPGSPSAPAVEISNLHKAYGRTVALHDLSLTVEPGEVFGFLGPNGAGKTTTIKVLLGLDDLHGADRADGGDFDYTVGLDGGGAPSGHDVPVQADVQIVDRRGFSGLYGQAFWG